MNFWQKLKKPILALAPMANVTDAAFRRIIAKYGKPDLFYTEFVSVEGLIATGAVDWVKTNGRPTSLPPSSRLRRTGKLRGAILPLLIDLMYDEIERPIVAQIFGGKPEQFFEVAKLCKELKFDGIDINMGCPDAGVEKSGGGAALIKNSKLAAEIIRATQEGSGLPVSVKTRIGYNENEIDTWIPTLLETKLAAITVHLRTRKEMSAVPAHWEMAGKIVEIRNKLKSQTLILGNGDMQTVERAREKAAQYELDGIMIGRGIFGNPWLFAEKIPSVEERLRICLEHTKLFLEIFKEKKNFEIMKKHYKAYINGFDGAKELRMKLMEAKDVDKVEKILANFKI